MKKIIQISFLLQCYFASMVAGESMIQIDCSNNRSTLGLLTNLGYQSVSQKGLAFLPDEQAVTNNSQQDNNVKEPKGYMEPFELETSFLGNSNIPQSPWSLRENDDVYRQRNLCRNEEINRLKILEEEVWVRYCQFVSPVFHKADYIKARVESSTDRLSDSAFAKKDEQGMESSTSSCCLEVLETLDLDPKLNSKKAGSAEQKMESPTSSCCSEVLEVFDFTTE